MRSKNYLLTGLSTVVVLAMSGCFEKKNELHETMVQCPHGTVLISDDFEGKPVCQLRGSYTEDMRVRSISVSTASVTRHSRSIRVRPSSARRAPTF